LINKNNDALIAFTITPTNNNVTGSNLPLRLANVNTTATETSAPASANPCCDTAATKTPENTGNRHKYEASDAPDETPSKYGSASGFRKIAWYATPATAKAPPTSDAINTASTRNDSSNPFRAHPHPPDPTIKHPNATTPQITTDTPTHPNNCLPENRVIGKIARRD
jgi:hypothetical protein